MLLSTVSMNLCDSKISLQIHDLNCGSINMMASLNQSLDRKTHQRATEQKNAELELSMHNPREYSIDTLKLFHLTYVHV